nr:integrase, catalytic region, zinc finger, CCHC-type, peptidase aspartic, catalytic [Tanacetum cinerariifolium]
MLKKDNYVPWSSRIIRYARSRPNGKMIVDSIENGPYVSRMIATPGEPDLLVLVPESLHEQTDEELTETDIKRMDADDQAIQTILLGLPEDIYVVLDSCETAKEIWEHDRQMMKVSDIGEQEKNAKLFNEWEKFMSTDGESIKSYYHRHVTIVRQTKNLHEADFTQIYNFLKINQEENGLVIVPGIANQNGTGNVVVAKAEGTGNGNQARCYNCKELGYIARNYTARPRRRDAAYLQTQLLIAQKEKAGIQLQVEEFDFIAAAGDLDEIKEVNDNCILMANLQQASTSSTQHDRAPVHDTDGSAEIVELEFQVVNYEREISHLKTTYKNLFDSIKSNRAHAKLHDLIFENAKLRARLFEKTFESVKNTSGTSVTSHGDKPKLSVVTPLSKMLHASMTSHSVPQPREFNVVKHRNLIAPGMFKINPSQTPRPKGNTRNARVPSASKSSEVKKIVTIEDHRRTLLLSNNRKTMSSECNNIKLVIRNDKSEIVCDTCKQCLVTANHDACLTPTLSVLNSRANKLYANVSRSANQKRHKTHVWKPKQVGSKERLTPKPRLPRFSLKWSPSGHSFDLKGKLVAFKETNCPSHDKARNIKLLINFVWKFLGTVRFGNDHIAVILGYGDLKWGNVTITRVYFVEGLGHNLFSVGQFCDADLEVAFRRNTCFIRDLDGVDLLKGNRSTNLYTINLHEMTSASLICLMARATPTKSTKDETPEVIKNFLKKIYVRLQAPVIIVRIDNGTEFKNQVLKEYCDSVGITHKTSAAKTPQQNGVVKRINRTLVEAARTILIFSHASLFLWAEVIATACYTQNHSIIHLCFNKTPYELIQGRKLDISYLHVFEALCYLKNDREDIGKLDAKGNVGFFIGYSANFVAYRVYNWRTRKIIETMNVMFDELSAMDFEQNSSRPRLQKAPRAIPDVYLLQNLRAPTASMYFQDFAPQQRNHSLSPTASAADNVLNVVFEGDLFVNPFGTPSTESVVSST